MYTGLSLNLLCTFILLFDLCQESCVPIYLWWTLGHGEKPVWGGIIKCVYDCMCSSMLYILLLPVLFQIIECLLCLRADEMQRIAIQEKNKVTYSSYMQLSNR